MASKQLEIVRFQNGEIAHIDLDDVLDILDFFDKKGHYTIVFTDGDIWYNVKLRKTAINKFNRKRGVKK